MNTPNLIIQPTRLGKLTFIDTTSNRPRMRILGTFELNEDGSTTFRKRCREKLSEAIQEEICWMEKEIDYV